ncbi:MAG: prepilin-type N-terminal cleavage/methylation domain-containing protein [Candidatus Nealsonbacteria bacterium]
MKFGFTLIEISVTMAILSLVLATVYGVYNLSQKAYITEENMVEITQNGRVVFERLSREIRQATEIVTELSDQESLSTSTIMFEDGHIAEPYHYIRYFQDSSFIKKEVVGFYFSEDQEETLVSWDSVPPPGQVLSIKTIQEAQTIGEYITWLKFWAPMSGMVNIALNLNKKENNLRLETKVFGRNF